MNKKSKNYFVVSLKFVVVFSSDYCSALGTGVHIFQQLVLFGNEKRKAKQKFNCSFSCNAVTVDLHFFFFCTHTFKITFVLYIYYCSFVVVIIAYYIIGVSKTKSKQNNVNNALALSLFILRYLIVRYDVFLIYCFFLYWNFYIINSSVYVVYMYYCCCFIIKPFRFIGHCESVLVMHLHFVLKIKF